MSVKTTVYKKLIDDVIAPLKVTGEWKVLVLDKQSTKIMSSCIKMHEITNLGITLVENIVRRREVLPFEAIYLIEPTEESVQLLIEDFSGLTTVYPAAHVFFTEVCPQELFNRLCQSSCARYLKALKEVNIAYLPCESRVFSLDSPESLAWAYLEENAMAAQRQRHLARLATKIATLCATLGEFPVIRYDSTWSGNAELAKLVQSQLEAYKAEEPSLGEGLFKERSQLILLDRGFDPISPLLHELTFQAMAYDLLGINHDVYRYATSSTSEKEVVLDESDPLWCQLRHNHIAVVMQTVPTRLKAFFESKHIATQKPNQAEQKMSLRDLSVLLKKLPQYHKELGTFMTHLSLAEECFAVFNLKDGFLKKFVTAEQDLAMGSTSSGEAVKDPLQLVAPLLLEAAASGNDKLRLVLLYTLLRGGVTIVNFLKMLQTGQIGNAGTRDTVAQWALSLGLPLLPDNSSHATERLGRPLSYRVSERRHRENATVYESARWTPFVKDLMEDACQDKLDPRRFPVLPQRQNNNRTTKVIPIPSGQSARYGQWMREENPSSEPRGSTTSVGLKSNARNAPRLIFFILGGVTHSEMRCAYEVSESRTNGASRSSLSNGGLPAFEVIIGGSHILTPQVFLNSLQTVPTQLLQPSQETHVTASQPLEPPAMLRDFTLRV